MLRMVHRPLPISLYLFVCGISETVSAQAKNPRAFSVYSVLNPVSEWHMRP